MKRVPEIKFIWDDSSSYALEMDAKFEHLNIQPADDEIT